MSSDGELYITEECRDEFEKELNEAFGKDEWYLSAGNYMDIWELSSLPNVMDIEVYSYETDEVIGTAEITNEFYIESDGHDKWVEARPKKIKIKKVKK